ncbi:MAG: Dam family site-specific DNA-(adenine-N6)-methyltransferase [Thiohalomonadaceae bacterium]
MPNILKTTTPRYRPPLKWAGNKYQILDQIKARLPQASRLIEPFAGSGALFLNTDFNHYLLNDINSDLIDFYLMLQKDGQSFIAYAQKFFTDKYNDKTAYYDLREKFNATKSKRLKAALFLYLNRHGYNGLCRYNSSGQYNVPFGSYKRPYFPTRELSLFAAKSQGIKFTNKNFFIVMQEARHGDIVYCDPPYTPLSTTANFTTYSAGGFNMEQHVALATMAEDLAEQGIPVLISNHNTISTRKLYASANVHKFQVRRMISRDGGKRNMANELLAVFSSCKERK